jgi:hypothetical protein
MGNKLREAEKKKRKKKRKKGRVYDHVSVVFLKTESRSAGEETRFQRTRRDITAIGRQNNAPRPIPRHLQHASVV